MIADRLHHVSISVQDIDRARNFYGKLLGLKEIERPDFPFPGAWYQAGACQIHLIVAPQGVDVGRVPAQLSPLAPHTAFRVENYQQTVEGLRDLGLEVMETRAEVGQIWVQDPDGNVLEFIAPAQS